MDPLQLFYAQQVVFKLKNIYVRKDKKQAFLTKNTMKKTDNRNRPTDSSDIELRK